MPLQTLHRRWPALIKTGFGMAEGAVVAVDEGVLLLATDVRLPAGHAHDVSVELPKARRRVLLRVVPRDAGARRRDVRGWAHQAGWSVTDPDDRAVLAEERARDGAETRPGRSDRARPRFHLVELDLADLLCEARPTSDGLVAVVPDHPGLQRGDVLHVRVRGAVPSLRIKGTVGRRSRRRPVMELRIGRVHAALLLERRRPAA